MMAPAIADVPEVDPRRVGNLPAFQGGHSDSIQGGDLSGRAVGNARRCFKRRTRWVVIERRDAPIVGGRRGGEVRGAQSDGESVESVEREAGEHDERASTPFPTDTSRIAGRPLARSTGLPVLVQRYAPPISALRDALRRGGDGREIAKYRWALPADTKPLKDPARCAGGVRGSTRWCLPAPLQVQNYCSRGGEGTTSRVPRRPAGRTSDDIDRTVARGRPCASSVHSL